MNPRKAVDSVDITLNNPLSQDEEVTLFIAEINLSITYATLSDVHVGSEILAATLNGA